MGANSENHRRLKSVYDIQKRTIANFENGYILSEKNNGHYQPMLISSVFASVMIFFFWVTFYCTIDVVDRKRRKCQHKHN